MEKFNLEDIALDSSWEGNTPPTRRRGKGKPKTEGRFIKGPVPLPWLIEANKAGGSSLAVGNILWHLSGLKRGKRTVALTTVMCKEWGVGRESKRRALEALEEAGLIRVEHRGNKNPLVTILDGGDGGRA